MIQDGQNKLNSPLEEKKINQYNPEVPIEEVPIPVQNVLEGLTAPKSIGSDFEGVSWINGCIERIFNSAALRTTLAQQWLDSTSKYAQSLDVDVSNASHYDF